MTPARRKTRVARLTTLTFVGVLWSVEFVQRPATVRIQGIVTDSAGRGVPFANVMALPKGRRVVSDADGRFALDADSACRAIEIRRIGFAPKTIERPVWPDSVVQVSLDALPARLERVRVEAIQRVRSLVTRGFYDRQADLERGINHGFVITPEEIEERKGARPTDFLRNHPGVKVAPVRQGGRNGRRGLQPQGLDGCRMEIYVDGARFYAGLPREGLRPGDMFLDDFVPVSNIAAMEVYPRAVGAPPKYQSMNGSCGVMLIWTK